MRKQKIIQCKLNVIKTLSQNNVVSSDTSFGETRYTYDSMNNLVGVTGNTGTRDEAVQYWYDSANRMLAMRTGQSSISVSSAIPQSGAVTKYEYDKLGYVSKETDALGNYSTFENDYLGNVLSGIDRNQNEILNEYGPFGMTYSGVFSGNNEDEIYYTYDKQGRQTKKLHNNINGTDYLNYTYDAFGRVIKEIGDTYENVYEYDLNSNISAYTLKEGSTTKSSESYTYDEVNNLTSQTVNGKIITYEYSEGLMLKKNMDGIETNITYTRGLQPETYTVSKGDTIYSSYTYTYSRDGNRLSEADSVNNLTRTYAYDNTGRLTGESISGTVNRNTVYTYDMRGNRTKETVTGDESYVMTNTYDLNNRLTKQTKSNGSGAEEGYQYYYDNNGNQTFKQRFGYSTGTMMSANLSSYSNDIESFTYNARNQLTEYTKGSTTASYTYSANGLRKSKTVGSTVTGFIWNGQNLAAETNGSTVKNIYSYGPEGIQCGKINGSDILYVKDAHGNTVTTLNGSKESIRDYTYDAFGNQLSTVLSSDTNPFRYCGEYYDNESGNIYLRARYYDSKNGRFISEDSYWNVDNMIYRCETDSEEEIKVPSIEVIFQSYNLYNYCINNPLVFIDKSGLSVTGIVISASASIGVAGYEGQVILATDDIGNIAILSANGFPASAGLSASGMYFVFPDMPSVKNLEGAGMGLSISAGISGAILTSGKYVGYGLGISAGELSISGDVTVSNIIFSGNVNNLPSWLVEKVKDLGLTFTI